MTDTPKGRAPHAPDLRGADWFKSSHSGGEQACVEMADVRAAHGAVAVRDSKDPDGPALVFSDVGWSAFIAAIQHGEFA